LSLVAVAVVQVTSYYAVAAALVALAVVQVALELLQRSLCLVRLLLRSALVALAF
jgi:hypothetical protein